MYTIKNISSSIRFNLSNIKYFSLKLNKKQTYPVPLHYVKGSNLTTRDVLDSSHGETGTLDYRFIKYIALENCKFNWTVPKTIKYSQYYPLANIRDFKKLLKNTEQSQLPQITIFTSTFKTNAEPTNIVQVINSIDNECNEKLDNMTIDEILMNLYSFMYLIPNKITRLEFYKSAIKKLVSMFDNLQPKEIFVQICYYIGLSKNYNTNLMKNFLSDFSDHYLEQLNTTDVAIVANAAFKASKTFESQNYNDRVLAEVVNVNLDNDLLITFVKSLRLNRVKSDDVIQFFEAQIKNESINFDFKGFCHIFAFFAENKYNETKTSHSLLKHGMDILEAVNPYEFVYNDARPKDLSTFLWSCAQLKISTLQEVNFQYFEDIIIKKIERNEYKRYLDELIDTCLSLWMLNFKSSKLIGEVLRMRLSNSEGIKANHQRIKLESRFKLLTNMLQIEPLDGINIPKSLITNPFDEKRPAPDHLCKNNVNLNNVHNILTDNRENLNIKNIYIVNPILELNIPGLLVEYNDDQIFLEILDDKNKLRFNNEPNAFVTLKVNTLKYLKRKVALIDVENTPTEKILENIKEIIK